MPVDGVSAQQRGRRGDPDHHVVVTGHADACQQLAGRVLGARHGILVERD